LRPSRHTGRRRLLAANLILLLAAAVWCRAAMLDRVPGLNGDEAWQGVQVQQWLRGESIDWRTPTGNLINPLTFFPMAALHAFLPPSITLLRLTPLVSGLLALALNYVLCRRVLTRRIATISTVILAVLPATIAYSRFAWDASQTLLVTLPVVYCSLGAVRESAYRRRWLAAAVAAWALAVLVHPTNVFLAPLVVAAAAWCWRDALISTNERLRSKRVIALSIAGLLLVSIIGIYFIARPEIHGLEAHATSAARRLVSPVQAAVFVQRALDLLSGTTVYRYIPASQLWSTEPATLAYRAAAWAIVLMAGYGLWRALQQRRQKEVLVLLIGLGASLAAFYVVAGPGAIQPHFERYGLWMIAPCSLLLALGLSWWIQSGRHALRLHPAFALLTAWAVLAGFGWHYFRPLLSGGPDAHVAFRTGPTEPKLAALNLIRSQPSQAPGKIVASGWWLFWPLQYLAGGDPRWTIVPKDVPTLINGNDAGSGNVWHVQICDSEKTAADGAKRWTITDAAGRPVVRIIPPASIKGKAPLEILP